MQKITPFLWYDGQAEEAMNFYVSVFKNAKVLSVDSYGESGPGQPCGWLRDKFGVSWQIIPTALGRMLHDEDAEKSSRVMQAMLQMSKIDIATLQQAYEG